MRPFRLLSYFALLLVVLSAACAPTDLVNKPAPGPQSTPTLVPLVPDTGYFSGAQASAPGGPQMQVGSEYRYFDGSLLDAVPNNGPFLMGANGPDSPQHRVSVGNFWIYSTDVSNQMYDWCIGLGKCTPPNAADDPAFRDPRSANDPVVGVTWQQASDYCSFAHGRLPTEAEWEKAASWDAVNSLQLPYPWGDPNPTCSLLNIGSCVFHATSVVQYGQGRSPYGAYNMEGDVFQWVGDWYQPNYYTASPSQDPTGPAVGTQRVIRGSAFDSDLALASPSRRFAAQPTTHRSNLGFRCVVQDPSYFAPFCTLPAYYGLTASVPGNNNPCPNPTIQHFEGCTLDSQPVDFVTVLNSGPTTVTVSGLEGCDPANNDVGVKHTCPIGVTVKVTASCNFTPSGSVTCLPGYRQDPNNPLQCTSPGGAGVSGSTSACPAGFQYDTSLKCCTVATGASAPAPLCSVGQHYFQGQCVDDATGPRAPESTTYTTFGLSCILPTSPANGSGAGIVPVPTNPPPPNPPPGGGKCKHNPHGCVAGTGLDYFLNWLFGY